MKKSLYHKLKRLKQGPLVYILNGLSCFTRPEYVFFLLLGFLAWFFPEPGIELHWGKLLYLALIEELVFRFFLQDILTKIFSWAFFKKQLSLGNIIASLIFSLLHLFTHPPLWALAVFFPSLVFGWAWDRYHNIIPCWILHFFYNLAYFYRVF